LGAVHDGMMVNVRVDKDKLRQRACSIIMTIAGVDARTARRALEASAGEVKCAILIAAGVKDVGTARDMLVAAGGNLRRALAQMSK
jgi:N-acetylmuramic acid 6-phosphate etherase